MGAGTDDEGPGPDETHADLHSRAPHSSVASSPPPVLGIREAAALSNRDGAKR
ncbi:hypothetical protein EV284_3666 [Streptomyces sp. BK022]|nr:hypothetical protein EV284_3666 [Streptomyces sp. BK022]